MGIGEMNARQIVRAAIPDATDEVASHILWGRTAYPFCGPDDFARTLYRAASGWRRACDHKLRLCDLCNRVAAPESWTCTSCDEGLARCRADHEQSIPV